MFKITHRLWGRYIVLNISFLFTNGICIRNSVIFRILDTTFSSTFDQFLQTYHFEFILVRVAIDLKDYHVTIFEDEIFIKWREVDETVCAWRRNVSYHDDLEKEVVRQWLYVRVILFRLFRLISSVCLRQKLLQYSIGMLLFDIGILKKVCMC